MSASPAKDASEGASGVRARAPSPGRRSSDPVVDAEEDPEERGGEKKRSLKEISKEHTGQGDEARQGQAKEDGDEDEDEEEEKEEKEEEEEEEEGETKETEKSHTAPPLPDEVPPPLPSEAPPGDDDGWEPVWDATAQTYYFYNRFTGVSQWENPRVPQAATETAAEEEKEEDEDITTNVSSAVGGYNPAIHGDYDPTAPYAQVYEQQTQEVSVPSGAGIINPSSYDAAGSFNRFTGRWQAASQSAEYHNDENKSRRQMNAYFDVDAAANSHDGRSLRAERSAKKLSKKELKMFKEKRREKKEEKRRAWLRD